MNSFIAWIGGKKLLRKEIVKRFPEEGFTRYVEVFGGAGWVLFEKEQGKELEVFNDRDSNLINLYRCIKYHCGELQRELEWLTISREQFFDSKSQLDSQGLTDIQRAARFFHIIKVSFGSDRRTFGTNKKNLANAIEYLPLIQKRLQSVVIENKDFENLIRVYDRPGALFLILSRLVDTFFSRISLTMPPAPKSHNTACVLPQEEPLHWQSRSSGYSSS